MCSHQPTKNFSPELEAIARRLLHSEVLLTLAGLKPLSIVRGFTNQDEIHLWKKAAESGVIHPSDLIWSITAHTSGIVTRFASRTALTRLNLIQGLDATVTTEPESIFGEIDTHSNSLDEFESHRFWGVLLGYPRKQIELYALARTTRPDLWAIRQNMPFFPMDLGSEFGAPLRNGFSTFNADSDEELTHFHASVKSIVTRLNEMKISETSYVNIVNNWKTEQARI